MSRYAARIPSLDKISRAGLQGDRAANWPRYGVQPKEPGPGLVPGYCASKAHDRENFGLGGRPVLVSRKWSGKTLTEHRADRAAVVRQVLQAAGVETPEADRLSTDVLHEDGQPRFVWDELPCEPPTWTSWLARSRRRRTGSSCWSHPISTGKSPRAKPAGERSLSRPTSCTWSPHLRPSGPVQSS